MTTYLHVTLHFKWITQLCQSTAYKETTYVIKNLKEKAKQKQNTIQIIKHPQI